MWCLLVAISDDQVVCTFPNAKEIIVDTVTGDIVSTFAVSSYQLIASYRNLHLLAYPDGEQAACIQLQQRGQSVPRWKLSLHLHADSLFGCFSPEGQFIAVVVNLLGGTCAYVLDVVSGNVRFKLSKWDHIYNLKFVSDEEFVIFGSKSPKYFVFDCSAHGLGIYSVCCMLILDDVRLATLSWRGTHRHLLIQGIGLKTYQGKTLRRERKFVRNGEKVS